MKKTMLMKFVNMLGVYMILCMAFAFSAYAAASETQIDVYINDINLNLKDSASGDCFYPIFENEGIIYIPLYEYTCALVDIDKPIFEEDKIIIEKRDVFNSRIWKSQLSGRGRMMTWGGTGYAPYLNSFYRYKPYFDMVDKMDSVQNAYRPKQSIISVAGTEINNENEKYPFLMCYNQLYLPLTWENCVNRLGWNYLYDTDEKNISINCNAQFKNEALSYRNINDGIPIRVDNQFVYINGGIKAKIEYREHQGRFIGAPGTENIRNQYLYIAVNGSDYKEIDYLFFDGSVTKEYWDIGINLERPNFEYRDGVLSVNAVAKNSTQAERINIDVLSGKILSTEEYKPPINPIFAYNTGYCYPYIELFDEYTVTTQMLDLPPWTKECILSGTADKSDMTRYDMRRQFNRRGTVLLNDKKIDFYTYNYDTDIYIQCEDLAYYGYDMEWNPDTRTTTLTRNSEKHWVDYEQQPREEREEFEIYDSDCKIIIDGKEVKRGYNMGGYTLIPIYELFGKFNIE